MKRKVRLISVLLVLILLIFAAIVLYIPASGEPLKITKNIYANSVIWQLEKEIDFTGTDIVTFQDGSFLSFEIKSHESAEVLYSCIRNATRLNDFTHSCLAPQAIPLLVSDACSGTFSLIYYTFPVTGRFIAFQFSDEDSKLLYEYVMSIVEGAENDNIIYIS